VLPDAAASYDAGQRRLTAATLALIRAVWLLMGPDFDGSWRTVGPRMQLVALSAQLGAARAADGYLDAVLSELDIDADAVGRVAPGGFVGFAGDGRPVESLLYGGVTTAKQAVASGSSAGGDWLRADAAAAVVRSVRDPGGEVVQGVSWVPAAPPISCDCRHIPATENIAGDLTTDPRKAYEAGQVRGLTAAQDKALRDGADLAQVVNSRRGMDSARSLTTREAARRGQQRLTPEGIYVRAGDDRAESIRLLRSNGYLAT
jgi:hypothetical protein